MQRWSAHRFVKTFLFDVDQIFSGFFHHQCRIFLTQIRPFVGVLLHESFNLFVSSTCTIEKAVLLFRTNCDESFLSSGRVCVRTSFIPEDFTPLPVPRDSYCMDRSTQAAQRGVICLSVYVFV